MKNFGKNVGAAFVEAMQQITVHGNRAKLERIDGDWIVHVIGK